MPPIQGHPLKLYLSAANESIGFLLAQNNSKDHEQAVYYSSKVLNPAKTRCTLIENLCLALYFPCIKSHSIEISYYDQEFGPIKFKGKKKEWGSKGNMNKIKRYWCYSRPSCQTSKDNYYRSFQADKGSSHRGDQ